MTSRSSSLVLRRTFIVALALAGATLHAQTVNRRRDASFKLSGVSVWKDGLGIDKSLSMGPQWSKSDSVGFSIDIKTPSFKVLGYTIPSIDLGKTGATLGYDVSAGFGFNAGVKYTGGTANIVADGDLVFNFDRDALPGRTCGVTVTYVPRTTSNIVTTSPSLSATLEETIGFEAAITASVDFLGKSLIDPNTKILDYTQPGLGFSGHNKFLDGAVANLNDLNTIKLLNANAPVGIEFKNPNAATTGTIDTGWLMTSTSFDPFVTIKTTLAQLILAFAGADKLAYFMDGSTTLPSPVALKASWDFAKVEGSVGLGLRHKYTFNPNPKVSIQITPNEAGQTIPGPSSFADVTLGQRFTFTMPASGGVTINGTFATSPTLQNKVSAAANGGFNITPIELSLKGKLGSGDFAKDIDWDFNPYSYDWTSDPASLFEIDNRTATYTVASQAVPSVQITPAVANAPTPYVYGNNDGTQEYLDAKAYNGFTYGADMPGPYRLQLYSMVGYGFCGIYPGGTYHASDRSTIVLTPETWDGKKVSDIVPPSGADSTLFQQYLPANSRSNVQLDINQALLRPGNHTFGFTVNSTFTTTTPTFVQNAFKAHYDIPVTVPLPDIKLGSDITNSTTGTPYRVDYLDSSYTGQELYVDIDNSLLETEIVLDDNTVLPTTRYGDKRNLGNVTVPQGGDSTHPVYTDDQEYRWFMSGNHGFSFNVPADLVKKFAGTVHTVRTRTKDPFSQGYVLSSDAGSRKLYFPAGAPTVAKVSMGDVTQNFPILPTSYALTLTGTNLTPATTVQLTLNGTQYPLAVEYVDSTQLKVTVPLAALDSAQTSGGTGTLLITTPTMSLSPAHGYAANGPATMSSGGSTSAAVSFKMPAPVITGVDPGSPVRDTLADLTITGLNFSQGNTINAQTQVKFDGVPVPANVITFGTVAPRGLTRMLLHLPASFIVHPGPVQLTATNSGGTSTFTVTVSNPKPMIVPPTGYSIMLGGGGASPRLTIPGILFNRDTQAFIGGRTVGIREWTATSLITSIDNLNVPTTTVSVLNPTPGGGQSDQVTLTILEGDTRTIALTRGVATFNALNGTYKQQFTMSYTGGRTLRDKVRFTFALPAGVTMTDGDGGQPYREFTVDMLNGGTLNFTVNLKTTAKTAPTFTTTTQITG